MAKVPHTTLWVLQSFDIVRGGRCRHGGGGSAEGGADGAGAAAGALAGVAGDGGLPRQPGSPAGAPGRPRAALAPPAAGRLALPHPHPRPTPRRRCGRSLFPFFWRTILIPAASSSMESTCITASLLWWAASLGAMYDTCDDGGRPLAASSASAQLLQWRLALIVLLWMFGNLPNDMRSDAGVARVQGRTGRGSICTAC